MPANIHSTAIVEKGAELDSSVQVGPYAIGTPSVDIPWAKLQDVIDRNGPLSTLLH